MKLQEWVATVTDELRGAGFAVEDYRGFPLVKPDLESGINLVPLLEFHPTVPCDRCIHPAGLIFLPPGLSVGGAA